MSAKFPALTRSTGGIMGNPTCHHFIARDENGNGYQAAMAYCQEPIAKLFQTAPDLAAVLADLEAAARQVAHGERSHIPAELWTRAQAVLREAGAL